MSGKRCCCGRIENFTESIAINEILHEELGVEDAFCGSLTTHVIRDSRKLIEKLTEENVTLKEKLACISGMLPKKLGLMETSQKNHTILYDIDSGGRYISLGMRTKIAEKFVELYNSEEER